MLDAVWLLAVGTAANGASFVLDGDLATVALAGSMAALIAVAAANRHLTGVLVIGAGLLLNLVAVVLNNGMPVRQGALEQAGVVSPGDTVELHGARHLETPSDRFGALGDALPVPITREVLSFGDLIVIAGALDATRELVRRRARAWSDAERRAYRVRAAQTSVVQDWGTAPSARPVSGSQYSAKPDSRAPAVIDLTSESATSDRNELVAASHSR